MGFRARLSPSARSFAGSVEGDADAIATFAEGGTSRVFSSDFSFSPRTPRAFARDPFPLRPPSDDQRLVRGVARVRLRVFHVVGHPLPRASAARSAPSRGPSSRARARTRAPEATRLTRAPTSTPPAARVSREGRTARASPSRDASRRTSSPRSGHRFVVGVTLGVALDPTESASAPPPRHPASFANASKRPPTPPSAATVVMSTLPPVMAKASAASYSSSRLKRAALDPALGGGSSSLVALLVASFRVLPVVVAAAFVVVVRAEAVQIIFPTLRFVGGFGAVGGVAVRGLERVVVGIWFEDRRPRRRGRDVASAAEDAGVGGHHAGGSGRAASETPGVVSPGPRFANTAPTRSWKRSYVVVAVSSSRLGGRSGALPATRARRARPHPCTSSLAAGAHARLGFRIPFTAPASRAHHADTDARDGVRRAEVSHQSQLVVVKRLSQRAVGRIP